MATTLFFYDLETSGVRAGTARIMQFAGRRTTVDLQPIGEPVNIFIQFPDFEIPELGAILLTGITPQHTRKHGITEAAFCKMFIEEIATPGTTFVGFNSVRFDDEFMRHLLYRNYYDPYAWQWQDGRSRWDLLDVVRMTRALRPEGIVWPTDEQGKPTNRLELLAAQNHLGHSKAHDALSDVNALIALAQLLRTKQSRLWDYLFSLRQKSAVVEFVQREPFFIYTSGKYASAFEKTTVVAPVVTSDRQEWYVFDLRASPQEVAEKTVEELVAWWKMPYAELTDEAARFPVKLLRANRCPAVAPYKVCDVESAQRLQLNLMSVEAHYKELQRVKDKLSKKLLSAVAVMDEQRQTSLLGVEPDGRPAEERLYEGFISKQDAKISEQLLSALAGPRDIEPHFLDNRLTEMWLPYRALNAPTRLSKTEKLQWQKIATRRLQRNGQIGRYESEKANTALYSNSTAKKAVLKDMDDWVAAVKAKYSESTQLQA